MRESSVSPWPALALVICFSGCLPLPPETRQAPPIETPEAEAPAGEGDLETRPFTREERAQSRGKLGGAWMRCYRAFRPTDDAPADLGRLTAACGPPNGMSAVTPVRVGELQAEDEPSERLTFRARGGRCYRFFAVGTPDVADLDLAVLDPDGRLAAADGSGDRFPVVPPRGPLCVERDGVYTVEAAVVRGSGTFVLQVWGD